MTLLAALLASSQSLMPKKFAQTYVVGDGQEYETISAAISASIADHESWVGTVHQPTSQTNPYYWRQILIHPGVYNERLSIIGHTALIGVSGNSEDVQVTWDGPHNVLGATGISIYVANLTLDHTSADPEWHPIRNAGPAGDVGMQAWQYRTTTFENVVFRTAFEGQAGKCAIDTTPGGACVLVYKDCWFDSPGQGQSVNMSVANPGLNPEVGLSWFINCKVTSNYGWTEDPTLPHNGYTGPDMTTPNPAAPVGLPDKGNLQAGGGRVDRVYWIGGEWDIGDFTNPIQGLIVAPNAHVGDNAHYFIDPDVPEGIVGGPSVVISKEDNLSRVLPPLSIPIKNGISDGEVAFYGPDPDRTTAVLSVPASSESTTMVTVPSGRVYWIAVDLPEVLIRVGLIRIATSLGALGNVTVATALPVYGNPKAIEPDGSGVRNTGVVSIAPGQQDVPVTPRWYYPGYGRVWVGVVFSEDTSVSGWTGPEVPGLDVLYTDNWAGGPITPNGAIALPAGSPFPAVWAMNTKSLTY